MFLGKMRVLLLKKKERKGAWFWGGRGCLCFTVTVSEHLRTGRKEVEYFGETWAAIT